MPQVRVSWLPFLLLWAASNIFQAFLKGVFCRDRTSKTWQVESSFFAHMRPDSVFCCTYLPFKQGFFKHVRPLQFAIASADDCYRFLCILFRVFHLVFTTLRLFQKWPSFPLLLNINWKHFVWLVWPRRPPALPPIRPPNLISKMVSISFAFQY